MNNISRLTMLGLAVLLSGCVQPEIQPIGDAGNPVDVQTADKSPEAAPQLVDAQVLRVGGDMTVRVLKQAGVTNQDQSAAYYSVGTASISAALPVDFAPPTPPGAIELKRYPVIRQALFDRRQQRGSAFFTLFRHIKNADIAMTAPVIMTGEMAGETSSDESSMAFLYRSTSQGSTGSTDRGVLVEDTPEMTVLSIGFQGRDNRSRLQAMQQILLDWLAQQPHDAAGQLHRHGSFRLLGYNGPDTATADKWWELQLPVQWASN